MKKYQKGFTLIELLVVVAIIGILAAVGVVAYNGYTKSAKKGATKSNHSAVMKYISAELKKCDLEGGKVMSDNLTCTGRSASTVVTAAKAALGDFKNPYSPADNAVVSSGTVTSDGDVGKVILGTSSDTVTIKTCHETSCGTAANRQEITVSIE